MSDLSVSSWSLHRSLGPMYPGLALVEGPRTADLLYGEGSLTLLEAPAVAAALGCATMEICHFHFPRTDDAYIAELRASFDAAGVRPLTLLIDDGDLTISEPTERAAQIAGIKGWIDVAAALGAPRARVAAGKVSPDAAGEYVRNSIAGLREVKEYAASRGVEVITENWLKLTADYRTVLAICEGLDEQIRLCVDFGNYSGPEKYEGLTALMPYACSVHCKASYTAPGAIEMEDFARCLELARAANFNGTYVLIFSDEGDEQSQLASLAEVIRPYLSLAPVA